MIGKKVRVNIYGMLADELYSGYADADSVKNHSAYILSKRPPRDFIYGVVIAVAALKGGDEKLIVAPEGEIHYEPEIRERLSHLRNIRVEKLNCLYEKSCGAIVIHKSGDRCKILLVRNHNGRNYSFPKGHVELGETEEETAIREVKEETGLDIRIIPSFREVADYCPFGKIRKRVVFFMAQTMSDRVHIQEEEIDSYIWVNLEDAHHRCTYDNDLRVIRKARENIDKLK
ncbi:bis(5'-nucleosyl)-tetraphosphatase [Ruminococcus sp.]|uniref:bis(5'-nucleosyl)-tetraphosphatase n=1 Tax=Ruminococcus sp. TaxID=41978 RepID=UPI0038908CE5